MPKDEQAAFVIKAALLRRNLGIGEKAALGAELKKLEAVAAPDRMKAGKKLDPTANLPGGEAREIAAAAVGLGARTIDAAEKVIDHGSKRLVAAMKSDAVAVSVAAKLADLPKAKQDEVLAGGKAERPSPRKVSARRVKVAEPTPGRPFSPKPAFQDCA